MPPKPAPPTTSRQVSHRPQPTLRRGLSSLRSEVKLKPFVFRLRDPPLRLDEEALVRRGFFRKEETRSLRKDYLQQSFWSNQFQGSPEVEDLFHRHARAHAPLRARTAARTHRCALHAR